MIAYIVSYDPAGPCVSGRNAAGHYVNGGGPQLACSSATRLLYRSTVLMQIGENVRWSFRCRELGVAHLGTV